MRLVTNTSLELFLGVLVNAENVLGCLEKQAQHLPDICSPTANRVAQDFWSMSVAAEVKPMAETHHRTICGATFSSRGTRFRQIIFEDAVLWLHSALGARWPQEVMREAAQDVVKRATKDALPGLDDGLGKYREWVVDLVAREVLRAHESVPSIDVFDPPIGELESDKRVTPAMYARRHPDPDAEPQLEPEAPDKAAAAPAKQQRRQDDEEVGHETSDEAQQQQTAKEDEDSKVSLLPLRQLGDQLVSPFFYEGMITTADRAAVVSVKPQDRLSALVQRNKAVWERHDVVGRIGPSLPPLLCKKEEREHGEQQQVEAQECVLCEEGFAMADMRRLTLACPHLCCTGCLHTTLKAALQTAIESGGPLICPGCAAIRATSVDSDIAVPMPGSRCYTVLVNVAVAAALPPAAWAMVDPIALHLPEALPEYAEWQQAPKRKQWEHEFAEEVARHQLAFAQFVGLPDLHDYPLLFRCPACPAFATSGLSCPETGAARCTNPRCAQLYCSRCSALPFHFGAPCPAPSTPVDNSHTT
eukprot:m51a1_g7788 hypothetical protein (530) ;mRNA; f:1107-3216